MAELQASTSSLAPSGEQRLGELDREGPELGGGAVAVREARGVPEVDEVLVRKPYEALVEDGEAADPGVEHGDRQV